MTILALDPAAKCGFAHSNGESGVWQITSSRDTEPGDRLERFRSLLYWAKRKWDFDCLAYEDAIMGANNFETAGMHAELRGVVKLVAKEMGVRTVSVPPSTLKAWAVNNGRAKKDHMIRGLRTVYGISVSDHNQADAIWVLKWASQDQIPERPKVVKQRRGRVAKSEPRLF